MYIHKKKGKGGQSEKSDVYIREQSRCEVSHLGINVAEARQRQKQTKRIERREVLDYWCTFTLAVVCCCLGCGGEEGKTTLFYYYDEGNTRSVKICAYATHTHTLNSSQAKHVSQSQNNFKFPIYISNTL